MQLRAIVQYRASGAFIAFNFFRSPCSRTREGGRGKHPTSLVQLRAHQQPRQDPKRLPHLHALDREQDREDANEHKGQQLHHEPLHLKVPRGHGALGRNQLLVVRRRGRVREQRLELDGPPELKGREDGHDLQEVHADAQCAHVHALPVRDARQQDEHRWDSNTKTRRQ